MLDDAQATADAEKETLEEENQRKRRRNAWLILGANALLSVVAIVVSVLVATGAARPVSADVARAVVPEVSRQVAAQVLADSRAQSADTYRANLRAANADLERRSLPIVGEPGPGATSGELLGAWVTARVLDLLPPSITDDLRQQVAAGDLPRVLPSAALDPDGDQSASDQPDRVITVIPGTVVPDPGRGGSAPAGPGGAATRPPVAGPSAPAPAPPAARPAAPAAPAPSGVLPLLPGLPLRVPLLSN